MKDIARIEKKLAAGWKPAHWRKAAPKSKPAVRARTPKPRFLESVRRAKEYISAGDIFQVVLSQRWDFEPGVAPLDLYRALRDVYKRQVFRGLPSGSGNTFAQRG